MRRPLLAALTIAGLLLAAHPSGAAATHAGLLVKDANGDANGVNGQGFFSAGGGVSSNPASFKAADIVSLRFATSFHKVGRFEVADGTVITMKVSGPIGPGVNYGVTATLSSPCYGDSTTIQLGYEDLYASKSALAICQASGGTSPSVGGVTVDHENRTITWTIDAKLKPGGKITDISATSSVFVVGVFDELTTDKAYVYGS